MLFADQSIMIPNIDDIMDYRPAGQDKLYSVLGCDSLSSVEQIHTEFKARARELHPDKAGGTESTEAFQVRSS